MSRARRRRSTRRPGTRAERQVSVSVETAEGQPGTWRVVAECRDEITTWLFMDGGEAGTPISPPTHDDLSGPMGRALVGEHVARCGSCRNRGAP